MSEWKDSSLFTDPYGDPRTWELVLTDIRLTLTRIPGRPGNWNLTCKPFFMLMPISETSADGAKKEAVRLTQDALRSSIDDLNEVL